MNRPPRPARLAHAYTRALERYERRRAASRFCWRYCEQKGWNHPDQGFRISRTILHGAGFWHRNPRHPQHPRLYYEDLVDLEEQALLLVTRLYTLSTNP